VRQFFTLRFWLSLLALAGLALGVAAFAESREGDQPTVEPGAATPDRTIDLVSWVYLIQPPPGFGIVDGRTTTDLALVLDGTRTMIVKAGTPGEIDCLGYTELARCTVAADLLGDAVLWFSVVPGVPGPTVDLPAVVELLDGGWVRLANGWVVPHAPVVDRSCPEDTDALTEFINAFGETAKSTFDFERQQIVKVTCPRGASATTSSTVPFTTLPGITVPGDTVAVVPEEDEGADDGG
jgi:hypothetical protein